MSPSTRPIHGPLQWVQPRFADRHFELHGPGELVGSLRWERALGTLATGEYRGKRWTFKRVGFWNPRVTVRREGSPDNLGVFHASVWGGGTLSLSSKRSYDWRPVNTWMTRWAFADDGGRNLFVMREGKDEGGLADMFKTQAVVEIEPGGDDSSELPLLILLGWYLFILRQEETVVVAAIT